MLGARRATAARDLAHFSAWRTILDKSCDNPFTTIAGVLREHFRWTAGENKLRAYESSPGKLRHFCSECGTHLVADHPAQPHVILRVATLDDDPGATPTMHIWTSHAVQWLVDEGEVPRYLEWQPGRGLNLRPRSASSFTFLPRCTRRRR